MISVEELFASNKFPKWISSNPVFSKLDYIRKVFPDIGLSNFEDKIVINNSQEIISCAKYLLAVIAENFNTRTTKLGSFAKKSKLGKIRRQNLEFLKSIMTTLTVWLRSNSDGFITILPTGKISLSIPGDLSDKDTLFMKKGTSLLKIYEKLNSLLREEKLIALKNISQAFQFKNFSSINLPAKEIAVKFAADHSDGLWDIATMSMRGITSCQTWSHGRGNSSKVIGSIIDPFTGIIYLTNNSTFNSCGSRMIRRCIVRYVIDRNNAPYILLEKMYPAFDKPSLNAFIDAIKSKLPLMTVRYAVDIIGTTEGIQSYVPLSDELKMLNQAYYPYTDSGVPFKEDENCNLSHNTQLLRSRSQLLFKKRMPKLFKKAIQSGTFKKAYIKPFGTNASNLLIQLRKPKSKIQDHIELLGPARADHSIDELGVKFTEFVCKLTDDPCLLLANDPKLCATFFTSEFGDVVNSEFAEFLTSNIITYINRKNPLK